jgi:hypothetical protein
MHVISSYRLYRLQAGFVGCCGCVCVCVNNLLTYTPYLYNRHPHRENAARISDCGLANTGTPSQHRNAPACAVNIYLLILYTPHYSIALLQSGKRKRKRKKEETTKPKAQSPKPLDLALPECCQWSCSSHPPPSPLSALKPTTDMRLLHAYAR